MGEGSREKVVKGEWGEGIKRSRQKGKGTKGKRAGRIHHVTDCVLASQKKKYL